MRVFIVQFYTENNEHDHTQVIATKNLETLEEFCQKTGMRFEYRELNPTKTHVLNTLSLSSRVW